MRDDELRDALHARADTVPVGRADEAGLGRRLAAARRRRQARLAGVAVALAVALGAGSLMARDDGPGPNVIAGPDLSSTTTPETSTTTGGVTIPLDTVPTVAPAPTGATPAGSVTSGKPPTTVPRTTSTTAPLPPVPDDALWPPPGSRSSFATPERAADDFARRFLGMATPQVIPGRVTVGGDEAVAELRPLPTGGPKTTLLLRRVGARGWVVVSSNAERIEVSQPSPGAKVGSPLSVRGRAQAFEGTVEVEVRRDGAIAPVGTSFGTGGGTEVLPFEATVSFARPSVPRGTLVVSEPRADDDTQGPAAATVIRITF